MIFNIIEPADMTYDELVFNAQLTPLPLAHLRVKLIFAQVYSVVENNSTLFKSAFSVKISPRLGPQATSAVLQESSSRVIKKR